MKVFGLEIRTREGVYSLREDTYLLAESLREEVKEEDEVLDVGTGTGILALIAARKGKNTTGTDINKKALRLAKINARENGITNVEFLQSDLFENIGEEKFNLIVLNPPYLPGKSLERGSRESDQWYGGENGRKVVKNFSKGVEKYLEGDGRILLLISSLTNLDETEKLFRERGFEVEVIDERKIRWEKLYVLRISR